MSKEHARPAVGLEAVPHPVEAGPGVLVHSTEDRRLAVEHWLLSTLPREKHARARTDWAETGVVVLPLGGLFSAVRLPAKLLLALIGGKSPSRDGMDRFLDQELQGPVICDPRYQRYYALVPASMPDTWQQAASEWRAMGVDCLGRGCSLGVPKVDAVTFDANPLGSYWSVPMPSLAMLCQPLDVARLIAACHQQLPAETEA